MTRVEIADNVVNTLKGILVFACIGAIVYGLDGHGEWAFLGILVLVIALTGMGTADDME